ncbi:MAG TPA: ATP-binding cassette domain-containing protein [Hyphomonadaceae bacterium]|nr:ATP-binding cassette domain-containing protein [Hyphomonadaceae bacterium]HPN05339.1 ATP-binding cassette domain-containing protein [Hyphomonadaceae bacterium]
MIIPLLSLRNVTVLRGDTKLVDDLSLTIQRGQNTVILGRNGSGKSTLVKLITRQLFPTTGDPVEIFGRDAWNVSELRTRLGVVSSSLQLDMAQDENLEVFEVAISGFFASSGVWAHHTVTNTMKDAADRALEQMGVTHLASRRLGTLSTGEARRVLIARALVHKPEALLLDEPCAGLDPTTRRHFLDTLRGLVRNGTTLLLVTHHVEEIIPEITYAVMMRGGRIAHDAEKSALMTDTILSEIFEAPTAIEARNGWYFTRPDV